MGKITEYFRRAILPPLYFVGALWVIHLVQFITGLRLGFLGIEPQTTRGLRGILFAPLIHEDWQHLLSNSIPFMVLSVIVLFFYPKVALRSFIMIYILTGIAVWIFGRPSFHIGASGVIYGLVSFVFWTGVFRRSGKSIVLALIVMLLYSGYFLGILPNQQENISWESHLLGALIGIFAAYWYKGEIEEDEQRQRPSWETDGSEQAEKNYFLPRDTFDKTLEERTREENQPPAYPWKSWTSDHTWRDRT